MTKKPIIIIGSIVAGIVLIIALFVGAILGIVFYSINHSEAAETARNFLRANEKLKQEAGEVKDFGSIVTGSVKTRDAGGNAVLHFKVMGTKRTIDDVTVDLSYRSSQNWRVTGASYRDEAGQTIQLLDLYSKPSDESQ